MTGPSREPLLLLAFGFMAVLGFLSDGCAASRGAPKGIDALLLESNQAKERAQRLYADGSRALTEGRLEEAKRLFGLALQNDPYYGTAQNDLGVVYYRLHDYYSAAVSFDAAASVLRQYEPYYNMGLVLERGGQLREAAEAYRTALRLAPGNALVMGNLVRTYVRMGEQTKETLDLVESALPREKRPEWREWLEFQQVRLSSELTGYTPQPSTARSLDSSQRSGAEKVTDSGGAVRDGG